MNDEYATQNKVMTTTNLNRDTTGEYLRNMISDGFAQALGESKGHKVYSATEKGNRWLKVYKSLLEEEGQVAEASKSKSL
jgi:predicted transcriptional regulator